MHVDVDATTIGHIRKKQNHLNSYPKTMSFPSMNKSIVSTKVILKGDIAFTKCLAPSQETKFDESQILAPARKRRKNKGLEISQEKHLKEKKCGNTSHSSINRGFNYSSTEINDESLSQSSHSLTETVCEKPFKARNSVSLPFTEVNLSHFGQTENSNPSYEKPQPTRPPRLKRKQQNGIIRQEAEKRVTFPQRLETGESASMVGYDVNKTVIQIDDVECGVGIDLHKNDAMNIHKSTYNHYDGTSRPSDCIHISCTRDNSVKRRTCLEEDGKVKTTSLVYISDNVRDKETHHSEYVKNKHTSLTINVNSLLEKKHIRKSKNVSENILPPQFKNLKYLSSWDDSFSSAALTYESKEKKCDSQEDCIFSTIESKANFDNSKINASCHFESFVSSAYLSSPTEIRLEKTERVPLMLYTKNNHLQYSNEGKDADKVYESLPYFVNIIPLNQNEKNTNTQNGNHEQSQPQCSVDIKFPTNAIKQKSAKLKESIIKTPKNSNSFFYLSRCEYEPFKSCSDDSACLLPNLLSKEDFDKPNKFLGSFSSKSSANKSKVLNNFKVSTDRIRSKQSSKRSDQTRLTTPKKELKSSINLASDKIIEKNINNINCQLVSSLRDLREASRLKNEIKKASKSIDIRSQNDQIEGAAVNSNITCNEGSTGSPFPATSLLQSPQIDLFCNNSPLSSLTKINSFIQPHYLKTIKIPHGKTKSLDENGDKYTQLKPQKNNTPTTDLRKQTCRSFSVSRSVGSGETFLERLSRPKEQKGNGRRDFRSLQGAAISDCEHLHPCSLPWEHNRDWDSEKVSG